MRVHYTDIPIWCTHSVLVLNYVVRSILNTFCNGALNRRNLFAGAFIHMIGSHPVNHAMSLSIEKSTYIRIFGTVLEIAMKMLPYGEKVSTLFNEYHAKTVKWYVSVLCLCCCCAHTNSYVDILLMVLHSVLLVLSARLYGSLFSLPQCLYNI